MKITSRCASARTVLGTDIAVIATRFAITVADFAFLDQIILADGSAIIVVKAIAPRSTAVIVVGTVYNVKIATNRVAGSRRSVKRIDGAGIGVVTCSRAIAVTDFVCFDDGIAAASTAIIVVVIVAVCGAAPVGILAKGDVGKNTGCGTIKLATGQSVRCANEAVIAALWTISVTSFSGLDDIVGAGRSTVIIVQIITARCAAPITRGACGDSSIGAVGVASG